MTDFAAFEVIELARGVVLANTPASLLKWLRRHEAVKRLANSLNEDKLLDIFVIAMAQDPRTECALAKGYGAFVAIILRRIKAGHLGAMPIDPTALAWGSRMWELVRASSPSTSQLIVEPGQRGPAIISVTDSGPSMTRLLDRHEQPIITTGE